MTLSPLSYYTTYYNRLQGENCHHLDVPTSKSTIARRLNVAIIPTSKSLQEQKRGVFSPLFPLS